MRVRAMVGLVAVLGLLIQAVPAWGSGHQVGCGSVITEDVTLTQDLRCTAGWALVVAASGVTLDLGGYTISGGGSASGIGVFAGETLHDVVIRHGTIRDFGATAVFAGETVDTALHGLTVLDGGLFWAVEAGHRTTISGSRFERTPTAVSLFWGGQGVVRDSTFVDNRNGVLVENFDDHVVRGNRFVGNERGVLLWDADGEGTVRDSVVTHNRFEGNEVGLEIRADLATTGTLVSRNHFSGNRGSGVLVTARAHHGGAAGTVVADNHFQRNGFDAPEITRFLDDEAVPGTVTFLADDGLTVVTGTPAEAAGVTVQRNRAFFNADLGIDAPGVLDGGGNHGRHNGDPVQCVGVRCRPGRP